MKHILFFVAGMALCCSVFGQSYKLDTKKSQINWAGSAAYNSYTLSGTLKASEGNFKWFEGQMTEAQIDINMKSLDADIDDLKKHLKSEDFFFVKQYPLASFTLTEAVALKEGKCTMEGVFNIRGKSRKESITLDAKKQGDKWWINGTLALDRTDYGIYYNSPNFFENLKQHAIADEIKLELELVFVSQ
jgi:polyisoprenoid-binding protein YceI